MPRAAKEMDAATRVLPLGEMGPWIARAWARLEAHPWPGNVRALRNTLQKLGIFYAGREIDAGDLELPEALDAPTPGAPGPAPAAPPRTVGQLRDTEREVVLAALAGNGGNKAKTARELGMPLSTLKRRLKKYGS